MEEKIEHIAYELKKARQNKQLSQRDLSARVGLPQAQISKIESGSVSPRLTSLTELARALDLEVMLVPRKFVPAVQAITRGADGAPPSSDVKRATHELKRVENQLSRLTVKPEEWHRLNRTIRELQNFRLSTEQIDAVKKAGDVLKRLNAEMPNEAVIRKLSHEIRNMRNTLAHAMPASVAPPRPAYSLDQGDDDA